MAIILGQWVLGQNSTLGGGATPPPAPQPKPGCVSWRINGLGEADLGVLMRGTLWRPPVSVRRAPVTIPGRHGVVTSGRAPVYDEPLITLILSHDGSNAPDIEAAANRMIRLVGQPVLTLDRVVTAPNGTQSVTSGRAELVGVDWGDFAVWSHADATVVLAVPNTFLRTPTADSTPAALGTSTTVTLDHLAGSTAPIVDAIVRIKGAITNPSVTDTNSGTGLWWVGTLSTSEYLFLDARNLRAWKSTSSSAWTGAGADVTNALGYNHVDRLQLWPDVNGAVQVRVTGTSPNAATVSVRAGGAFL